jgi:hypothetical protein
MPRQTSSKGINPPLLKVRMKLIPKTKNPNRYHRTVPKRRLEAEKVTFAVETSNNR